MIYIASDYELPLVPWTDPEQVFSVLELHPSHQCVTNQFSKPFVYYVGSYEGCGCGFDYGRWAIIDDDGLERYNLSRKSVEQFSIYLAQAIEKVGDIELFACWDGDQEKPPKTHLTITPQDIGDEVFRFDELAFIVITGK